MTAGKIVFRRHTWDEALAESERDVPFVIEGLISSMSTLIYGEAKAGKSFFVSAIVAALAEGKREFLGQAIHGDHRWRVGIAWTDDRAHAEYARRVAGVLPEGMKPDITFYQLLIMRGPEYWDALFDQVIEDERNLLVIDNLSQAIHGSLNDDRAVNEFFDGVRKFIRAGIPVIIVGHSSEKTGSNGYKPQFPLGSSVISSAVRAKLFFYSTAKRDRATVKYSGADREPWSLTLHHGVGARFSVISIEGGDGQHEQGAAKLSEQDQAQRKRDAEIAQWVVDNCQGKGRNAAAVEISQKTGETVSTVKTNLSKRRKYGALLTQTEGNRWLLVE